MISEISISSLRLFKNTSAETLEKIAPGFLQESVRKGEIITPVQLDKNIYFVEKGEIELFQLSLDGKKIIIDRYCSGEIFADTSLSLTPVLGSAEFVQALQDTTLLIIAKSDFLEICKEVPQVAMNLVQELSMKLKEADNKIRDLAVYNPSVRLLNELIRLAKRYGSQSDGNVRLDIKFTHKELAQMIGSSRETVTRCLAILKHKGFIDFDDANKIVIDQNKTKDPYSFLLLLKIP